MLRAAGSGGDTPDAAATAALDILLWEQPPEAFLPHRQSGVAARGGRRSSLIMRASTAAPSMY